MMAVAAGALAPPLRTPAAGEVRRKTPDGLELVRWPAPRGFVPKRRSAAPPAAPAPAAGGPGSTFISVDVPPVGKLPIDLAFTPDGTEVAIANRDSGNVTFFDVASGMVTRTVAVGQSPLSLAVTPDGRYVLTADAASNTVSAIDLATHTLAATVPLSGQLPYRIEVTRDGRFAVVALANDSKVSAFSVIDLATLREAASYPTPPQGTVGGWTTPSLGLGGSIFTRFRLTPDGNRIVLPLFGSATVLVLDRATGKTLGTVAVPAAPWDVDVSADGAFAVVGHEHDGGPSSVTRIDLQTLEAKTFSFTLDSFFQLNRVTPDGRYAIVTGISQALFVDLQTGTVTAGLPSVRADDLAFTADGRYAFLAPGPILDVASQQPAFTKPGTAAIGTLTRAAAAPAAAQAAAIDTYFGESVYLYDLSGPNLALQATAPTGEPPEAHAPRAVAVTPDGSVALVANRITGNLAVIDLTTATLQGLIPIQPNRLIRDVQITADGRWAVAVDSFSTTAIVDVAAMKVAATLGMTNPERVLLAPGGRTAYVFQLFAAEPHYVSVVSLDGPASSISGTIPTVARSLTAGYAPFDEDSGVALSADGSVIAVCGSQSGQLELIDTASRRDIARLEVGTFPMRVALSADGRRAWVADPVDGSVTVVQSPPRGGGAAIQAVVSIPQPFDLYLDAAGDYLYVVSESLQRPAIYVVDAHANRVVTVVDVPETPGFSLSASRFLPARSQLYLTGMAGNPSRGVLMRYAAAGPASKLIDTTPLTDLPLDLDASADGLTAVASQVAEDGVDEVRFPPPAPCVPAADQLCLVADRFVATAGWLTADSRAGSGQALPLTDGTGLFWFFAPEDLELVVKVLDGCAVNGHYWFFAAGLTDVQVTLHVQDTATGAVRIYDSRLQAPFQPIQDTAAFAGCP